MNRVRVGDLPSDDAGNRRIGDERQVAPVLFEGAHREYGHARLLLFDIRARSDRQQVHSTPLSG